jgi:hypothetical protein
MIEIKGNMLIITTNEKDGGLLDEIVDFVNSRTKCFKGENLLKLAEEYHQIDKKFTFSREAIYDEESRFHR